MKALGGWVTAAALLSATVPGAARSEGLVGEAEAVAAAWRILEAVGGREVWAAARTMYARETAYPPSLDGPIDVHIWRDLEIPTVFTEIRGRELELQTMRTSTRGWRARNGETTYLSAEVLAVEAQGWRQEPYVFYHRLATGGDGLRVTLDDQNNRLEVIESETGQMLCWFVLTAAGAPLKWGNIFDGEASEHTYGPLVDLGAANLPKWGASRDGSWRFEYIEVSFSREPVRWRDPPE